MNFDTDLSKLHPVIRLPIQKILLQLKAEGIALKVQESYRTPAQQQALVDAGDTTPPWHSKFQYGLACSFVPSDGSASANEESLNRLSELGQLGDLGYSDGVLYVKGYEPLSLFMGTYPSDGDASWGNNLSKHINEWDAGAKPPLPSYSSEQSSLGGAGTNSEREQKSVD